MPEVRTTRTLAGGLSFGEGTRWNDGRLWFSDAHAGRVMSLTSADDVRVEAEMPGPCSGLGWRADGTLLVLLTQRRALVEVVGGQVRELADFRQTWKGTGTDLVVDPGGRAYVGNSGFDVFAGEAPRPTMLLVVDPDGGVRVAAEGLDFPNGMVITPDRRTLIVAESTAHRLTAFTIADDGLLHGRRVFADLGAVMPDGIALDRDGCVWVASPNSEQAIRVADGGAIRERVALPGRGAFACMLGGPDGRTLFVATAAPFDFGKPFNKVPATIEAIEVSVPRDGIP
jgi:sugar lactone lactonase YvrE